MRKVLIKQEHTYNPKYPIRPENSVSNPGHSSCEMVTTGHKNALFVASPPAYCPQNIIFFDRMTITRHQSLHHLLGVYTCLHVSYNVTLSYVSGTATAAQNKGDTVSNTQRMAVEAKNKKDPEQEVDTEGNEGRESAHSHPGVNNYYLWYMICTLEVSYEINPPCILATLRNLVQDYQLSH